MCRGKGDGFEDQRKSMLKKVRSAGGGVSGAMNSGWGLMTRKSCWLGEGGRGVRRWGVGSGRGRGRKRGPSGSGQRGCGLGRGRVVVFMVAVVWNRP